MTVAIHAARTIPPIDWRDVPVAFQGKCSAVCRTLTECRELVRWFGDPSFSPFLPVLLMVPGAQAPTAIAGMGYATAAELQDCAVAAFSQQIEKIAAGKSLLDFDEARERRGLMRREQVDAAVREAMVERVARHKANPVSDPPRQPAYPNPTGKTVFGGSS